MTDVISKTDPLPYYAQLAAILRDEVRTGVLTPGDLLPSEAVLGRQFGLSRTAVRQALDALVDEGLVHKEKGRGTFVASPKVNDLVLHDLRGFTEEMARLGESVETELLGSGVSQPPPFVMADLGLNSTDRVVWLERVRRASGREVVAVRTWLPLPRFDGLLDHDLVHESLYEILADGYGVQSTGGRRRFEAEAASAALARLLGTRRGAPLLTLTAVNNDQDGRPFEYFVARYRADRAAFDVIAGAPGATTTTRFDVKAGA